MPFLRSHFRLALTTAFAGLAGLGIARLIAPTTPPLAAPLALTSDRPLELAGTAVPVVLAAAPKAVAGHLAEAAREKDFFRRAKKTVDAIEQLTAADFAEFVAQRKVPLFRPEGDWSPYYAAVADALVERWLAVDSQGAMPAMLSLLRRDADGKLAGGAPLLAEAIARLQPAALLAERGKLLTVDKQFANDWPFYSALMVLARTQPEAARRYAAEWPEADRQVANLDVALGMAETDPLAALKFSEKFSNNESVITAAIRSAERAGPGVVRQLIAQCGEQLRASDRFDTLCARYPEETAGFAVRPFATFSQRQRTNGVRAVLEQLPPFELQKRLVEIQAAPTAAPALITGQLLEAWAIQEPAVATEWALAHAGKATTTPGPAPMQKAFAVWREQDLPAALAWLQSLPASEQKSALGNRAALTLLQRGDLDAALGLYSPLETPDAAREEGYLEISMGPYAILTPPISELELLAYAAFQRDPTRAADWLTAMPGAEANLALHAGLREWAERDAEGAAGWIEALPDGEEHDFGLEAIAMANAHRDFAGAAQWAEAISDPARRVTALGRLYWELEKWDPPAARAWLREQPVLSTEEKAKISRNP